MADTQDQTQVAPAMGPGGVPAGEYNQGNPVFSGPAKAPIASFQPEQSQDDVFQGYTSKPTAPMYRTSNSDYGSRAPSVHTMPVTFHAKSQQFSADLGKCGMYRNHSLNCSTDKSFVPDH